MRHEFEYKTIEERNEILNNHPDLILREECNIAEGNFIFLIDAETAKQEMEEINLIDRMNVIIDYMNLDKNSVDNLESAIIEHETNLIMNGEV